MIEEEPGLSQAEVGVSLPAPVVARKPTIIRPVSGRLSSSAVPEGISQDGPLSENLPTTAAASTPKPAGVRPPPPVKRTTLLDQNKSDLPPRPASRPGSVNGAAISVNSSEVVDHKKKITINIVDARPMSQSGFRDMKGSNIDSPVSGVSSPTSDTHHQNDEVKEEDVLKVSGPARPSKPNIIRPQSRNQPKSDQAPPNSQTTAESSEPVLSPQQTSPQLHSPTPKPRSRDIPSAQSDSSKVEAPKPAAEKPPHQPPARPSSSPKPANTKLSSQEHTLPRETSVHLPGPTSSSLHSEIKPSLQPPQRPQRPAAAGKKLRDQARNTSRLYPSLEERSVTQDESRNTRLDNQESTLTPLPKPAPKPRPPSTAASESLSTNLDVKKEQSSPSTTFSHFTTTNSKDVVKSVIESTSLKDAESQSQDLTDSSSLAPPLNLPDENSTQKQPGPVESHPSIPHKQPLSTGPTETHPSIPHKQPSSTRPAESSPSIPHKQPSSTRDSSAPGSTTQQKPPRPGNVPPARPPSFSPIKQKSLLNEKHSATPGKEVPTSVNLKEISKPTKQPQNSAEPPLPKRPGPGHPLYSYISREAHGIALHDYTAKQPDEISFSKGDIVILIRKIDAKWMVGQVGSEVGMFPAGFIDVRCPLGGAQTSKHGMDYPDSGFRESTKQGAPEDITGPRCRARFDFEGEGEGELNLEDGDVVQIVDRVGTEWLRGEHRGRQGIFPSSFVEIIEDLPEGGVVLEHVSSHDAAALFDFDGADGELSFKAGDRITILSLVNSDWLYGSSGGRMGKIPSSFVSHIPPGLPQHKQEPAPALAPAQTKQKHKEETKEVKRTADENAEYWESREAAVGYGRAMRDCLDPPLGDLEFRKGDRIEMLEFMGEDWGRGRLGNKEGMVQLCFIAEELNSPPRTPEPEVVKKVYGKVVTKFDGETVDDLVIKEGDIVEVEDFADIHKHWRWGTLNGTRGMFPADYVELLPDFQPN